MRDYIEYLETKPLKHLVMDNTGRVGIDYADKVGKPASYFYGSWLVAKEPVTVYSSPNGTPLKKLNTGSTVGRIYSHNDRDGEIWWVLENNGGAVKHAPGRFDTSIAMETSSGQKHEELMLDLQKDPIGDTVKTLATGVTDTVKGVGESLSFLGGNLKWVLLGLGILMLVFSYTKLKTA